MDPLRVVLLGCGVVGSQVARLLHENASDLEQRAGVRIELAGIAVHDLAYTSKAGDILIFSGLAIPAYTTITGIEVMLDMVVTTLLFVMNGIILIIF